MPVGALNLIHPDILQAPPTKDGPVVYCIERGTVPGNYLIEETAKDGKMNLIVVVMEMCSQRLYLKDKFFNVLKNQRRTDGVIWECIGGLQYRLHLFELKRKIGMKNWQGAYEQFHGTLLRCQMVADLLGVNFDPCIHLYTVYHQDNNTDTVMIRNPKPYKIEQDWFHNRCDLTPHGLPLHWGTMTFQHHKIHIQKINDNGIPEGNYDLEGQCLILQESEEL